ncbi:MAG: FAD/NAD(P)-binding protein [Candidatus Fermentibacteraceae bacterium]|nr:FAD/NAD(P)-binding protein [Candidatus Fermentibacteraceae bacterium]MBN2608545.1 FAD/NAD(P)-binding protein [Candidatus Fermentibacteraceae bacterium]
MDNSYVPIRMRVEKIAVEDPERNLRTYDLAFEDEDAGKRFNYLPGQFCEMSILGKGESPFGIASSPSEGDLLKFTVNRAGSVTGEIHYLREGDAVGIRGPLGNWYPVEKLKGMNVLIIGGGFAFTTLRSLLVYLLGSRGDYGDINVIYGARNPDLFIYKNEIEEWRTREDMELHLTIDSPVDGWSGMTGFVPSVTGELAPGQENTMAIVCGPPIMIKFTLPVLTELGFPDERIYTSLERRMKCGIGKCGRCNIGSRYVCIDGPVFSLAQLRNIPEAF